jgi:thiamine-phosphate pyrophosphorylase
MAVVATVEAGRGARSRGATHVQLRRPGATGAPLLDDARQLVAEARLPVLVSSRVDVALAAGAAGTHLPEHDLPVEAARRLLPGRLLGRSVHDLEAARDSAAEGADYLIFGPVFATPTHPGARPVGLDALHEVASAVEVPVLAIGGVDVSRLSDCLAAGAAGYAAVRPFA